MVGTLFFKTLSFSIYLYVCIYLAVSSQMQQAESLIFEAAYQIFPCSSVGKESACNAGDLVQSWVGKIPWRRKWQPTPVFLPGESHGLRSLVGYSPWGCKSQTRLSDYTTTTTTRSSVVACKFLVAACGI